MELSNENLKKPTYWLSLPLEIGRAACNEALRELSVMIAGKPIELAQTEKEN